MIEVFSPEKHMPMLLEWWRHYGIEPLASECLPPTGFVVDGVAIGFVYLTNAKVGIVDHVIAKPGASAGAALLVLAGILHKFMVEAGCKRCVAHTRWKAFGRLWKRHGGHEHLGWALLTGDL